MKPQEIRTNAEIGDWLATLSLERSVLATTALAEPIWQVRLGGERTPPILITAGSHADEVAGVYAALQLAAELRTERAVYMVPCRDPLGWNGFAHTLRRVKGDAPLVSTHEDAARVLRQGDVLHDDGELVIARNGPLVFASQPTTIWVSTAITRHRLPALLETQPALLDRLRESRILVPGNVAAEDGRNPYSYGGHTAYVGRGIALHLNRFFDRDDAPIEVSALRALVDRIRPVLTLDLHEGFSNGFYLFTDPKASPKTLALAQAMVAAVRSSGGRVATRAELEPVWGPRVSADIGSIEEGIFTHGGDSTGERASLSSYCEPFGPAITTEPGMEGVVSHRVAMIVAGVRAVLERLE